MVLLQKDRRVYGSVSLHLVCGSLSYAAPEILRASPYNPKIADLWSLGVILYILLNKSMPFDDTDIKRLYEQQTNRKWRFRSKIAETLSEQVKKLVSRLLEPDVSKRWKLDQIISSEWIAMDPRLLVLSPAEQAALNNAMQERKKFEEKLSTKDPKLFKVEEKKKINPDALKSKPEEVTVIKKAARVAMSSVAAGPIFKRT